MDEFRIDRSARTLTDAAGTLYRVGPRPLDPTELPEVIVRLAPEVAEPDLAAVRRALSAWCSD